MAGLAVADMSGASAEAPAIRLDLQAARKAQEAWHKVSIKDRLAIMRQFRHLLACEAERLADLFSPQLSRSKADTLTAEVLPLAEAVRFLELQAFNLLAPARPSNRSRPLWLAGVQLQVQRDPWGLVLVIGPSNYPLFLPGVQALQALVAGNGVFWKPGVGGAPVAHAVADLLTRAGLPHGLLTVKEETFAASQELLEAGVDKVVMTGSAVSGRLVLRTCADRLTPATVELSGCDAMFVLEDADVSRSVDALLFGLGLNGSGTCIAPRRVFLHTLIAELFTRELLTKLSLAKPIAVKATTLTLVESLVADAVSQGARLLTPGFLAGSEFSPVVLEGTTPQMAIMRADVFAAVIGLCTFQNESGVLALANDCPYALGATVFGSESRATAFASRIVAGVVVVNDMIAPTADPRISFGGRRNSGFGKTRGAEGLLEMTVSKTIVLQTAKRLRHLEPQHPQALALFSGFLRVAHGRGVGFRLRSLLALGSTLRNKPESKI